jgi:N-acetylglucosaminyldiphosphoundecaprenol N-acetyl-beta-D-mannosaminyltransferase
LIGLDQRFALGPLHLDRVDMDRAIACIERASSSGSGHSVVTLNLHHLRLAWADAAYSDVLKHASLSVADGWPLVAVGRLAGQPLRSRVAGSDLVPTLLERRRWRIALLGGPPGTGSALRQQLTDQDVVLVDPLPAGQWRTEAYLSGLRQRLRDARPELVLIGIGAPAQEELAATLVEDVPAVFVGCGATLEFMAGSRPRAPRWMQRAGVEWLHRLLVDPRRLAPRYALAALALARLTGLVLWHRIAGPVARRSASS